jgi:hypothetical protein
MLVLVRNAPGKQHKSNARAGNCPEKRAGSPEVSPRRAHVDHNEWRQRAAAAWAASGASRCRDDGGSTIASTRSASWSGSRSPCWVKQHGGDCLLRRLVAVLHLEGAPRDLEGDAEDPDDLGVELVTLQVWPDRHRMPSTTPIRIKLKFSTFGSTKIPRLGSIRGIAWNNVIQRAASASSGAPV